MTVVSVGVTGVLLIVMVAGMALVGAALAAHRAQSAADLAALAAAAALQRGEGVGQACLRAQSIAGANRARLTSCSAAASGVVDVGTVCAVGLVLPDLPHVATGHARAGPKEGP